MQSIQHDPKGTNQRVHDRNITLVRDVQQKVLEERASVCLGKWDIFRSTQRGQGPKEIEHVVFVDLERHLLLMVLHKLLVTSRSSGRNGLELLQQTGAHGAQ